MARLLMGRSRRLQRQRIQQRYRDAFESLEVRVLLSAVHADDEVHSHPVFAPGTSQAYVDTFIDTLERQEARELEDSIRHAGRRQPQTAPG